MVFFIWRRYKKEKEVKGSMDEVKSRHVVG
jgi:hypothetical protein